MADFPSIEPDNPREHVWGDAPQAVSSLAGGVETRGRLAGDLLMTGEKLALNYPFATRDEVELIRGHYREQGDGLRPFSIPEEVIGCDGAFISRGEVWRYLEPPKEEESRGGRFSVQVVLGSIAVTWTEPPLPLAPIPVPLISLELSSPAPTFDDPFSPLYPTIVSFELSTPAPSFETPFVPLVPPPVSFQVSSPAPLLIGPLDPLAPNTVAIQFTAPAPAILTEDPNALRNSAITLPTLANVFLFPDVASALAAATAQLGGGDNGSGGAYDELYFFDTGGGTTNWVMNSFFDLGNVRGPFSSDLYYGATQANAPLSTHLSFLVPLYAGAPGGAFEYYGSL